MNAFVTYEQEDDGVVIHRVYVGEGKVKELLAEFYKEVTATFGSPPKLEYTGHMVRVPFTDNVRPEITPDSEQILNNWKATLFAAKSPHRFGDWLVEKHQWIECESVHQESL